MWPAHLWETEVASTGVSFAMVSYPEAVYQGKPSADGVQLEEVHKMVGWNRHDRRNGRNPTERCSEYACPEQ